MIISGICPFTAKNSCQTNKIIGTLSALDQPNVIRTGATSLPHHKLWEEIHFNIQICTLPAKRTKYIVKSCWPSFFRDAIYLTELVHKDKKKKNQIYLSLKPCCFLRTENTFISYSFDFLSLFFFSNESSYFILYNIPFVPITIFLIWTFSITDF